MSHQLIVLPDDTAKPLLDAIHGAKTALNIRMFLFTDESLLAAVTAAQKRGVKVRVMLNPARRTGESENEASRAALIAAGVDVRDSNPKFDLTHQKSMVVDNKTGYVESLNWELKDLTVTRDYAVITTHGLETSEMVACFEADWKHEKFTPHPDSKLIWCPDNGRERVAAFVDSAKHSLWVQNERYQDTVIIERLVRAATRGVKVHILTKPPHALKVDKLIEGVGGLRILQDVGVKVHTMKHLKLHAKMMLADDKRAIVGSINLDLVARVAALPPVIVPRLQLAVLPLMVALMLLILVLLPAISMTDDLATINNPAETDHIFRRHEAPLHLHIDIAVAAAIVSLMIAIFAISVERAPGESVEIRSRASVLRDGMVRALGVRPPPCAASLAA